MKPVHFGAFVSLALALFVVPAVRAQQCAKVHDVAVGVKDGNVFVSKQSSLLFVGAKDCIHWFLESPEDQKKYQIERIDFISEDEGDTSSPLANMLASKTNPSDACLSGSGSDCGKTAVPGKKGLIAYNVVMRQKADGSLVGNRVPGAILINCVMPFCHPGPILDLLNLYIHRVEECTPPCNLPTLQTNFRKELSAEFNKKRPR